MESCSNQNSVKQIKIHFRFFEEATLCLDDSFANSWHSLNQLHEVVTWNAFQLTGVPCSQLFCGISFLLNAFEPISCVVTSCSGIQKIAIFGKRPSPYYGKNSSK